MNATSSREDIIHFGRTLPAFSSFIFNENIRANHFSKSYLSCNIRFSKSDLCRKKVISLSMGNTFLRSADRVNPLIKSKMCPMVFLLWTTWKRVLAQQDSFVDVRTVVLKTVNETSGREEIKGKSPTNTAMRLSVSDHPLSWSTLSNYFFSFKS